MAGLDYTAIYFKNGKLLETPVIFKKEGVYNNYVPFRNYNGMPYAVREFEQANPEYKRGERAYKVTSKDCDIVTVLDDNYSITYCINGDDAYIATGGCRHHLNPYLHFYHRGYGEKFEKKMCRECLNYLCENILKRLLETIYPYEHDDYIKWRDEINTKFKESQEKFGYNDSSDEIEIISEKELTPKQNVLTDFTITPIYCTDEAIWKLLK